MKNIIIDILVGTSLMVLLSFIVLGLPQLSTNPVLHQVSVYTAMIMKVSVYVLSIILPVWFIGKLARKLFKRDS